MSEEDAQVSTDCPGGAATGLAAGDLAVDHALALLSSSMRFLLDVTPDNAEEIREPFLAGEVDEPEFSYRDLDADPDVLDAMLNFIAFDAVADPSLGSLLRAKARDVRLQIEMLRASFPTCRQRRRAPIASKPRNFGSSRSQSSIITASRTATSR
ncbi:DUF1704 domain-containing protein [Bowdeniella nasicola]|uniref:DUF1704 domain-containing protein n=1 Tax=Bowdeniella nasicola TaxID=208480 RepID=UPI001FE8C702|nr:DUF1704 domain-containing protein [Bowdeniella nasicola]